MKLSRLLVAGALVASFGATAAFASYNKGLKYYGKYVYRKSHIRSTAILGKLGITTPEQLKPLLQNNAKGLIEALKKAGYKKAAAGIEKIVKKHKLKDLEDFFMGVLNGKIPASCG